MTTQQSIQEKAIKLTVRQNAIIYLLQQGWELIGSNQSPWVTVCCSTHEFLITSAMFWKIHEMGLIAQDQKTFYYELTTLGREIKTKPVTV